jgi:response regulator of citrate/malate metabolism
MNESPLRVLLAEGGTKETSVSLRTFSTSPGRCDQMYLVPGSTSLLEALQKHRPDVALLQMLVLQPDPVASVSCLHECVPDVALIIWAEPADNQIAAKCIQAGAIDYMLEGFLDERTLDRVLRTAIAAKAEQESVSPAEHTPEQAADRQRGKRPGLTSRTVKMRVEIENFRRLQKRNGLLAAEQMGQEIGESLRKGLRASDSVETHGGGQYVIALRDAGVSCLPAIRRRITARLLSFWESRRLRGPLILRIADEEISDNPLAEPSEVPETATLPRPRDGYAPARP